jgi:hypothetical protein
MTRAARCVARMNALAAIAPSAMGGFLDESFRYLRIPKRISRLETGSPCYKFRVIIKDRSNVRLVKTNNHFKGVYNTMKGDKKLCKARGCGVIFTVSGGRGPSPAMCESHRVRVSNRISPLRRRDARALERTTRLASGMDLSVYKQRERASTNRQFSIPVGDFGFGIETRHCGSCGCAQCFWQHNATGWLGGSD